MDVLNQAKGFWSDFRRGDRFHLAVKLLLYLAVTALMLHLFDYCAFIKDEGIATVNAWRISDGQVPYRDFFEIVPPFSFLPTAALFKLFGPSVFVERALTFLLGLSIVVGADLLLKKYGAGLGAQVVVVAFLGTLGVYYYPMFNHHWVADASQIYSILFLAAGLGGGRTILKGIAAGSLATAGLFSLQDQGSYFLAGLLLLFFPFVREGAVRARLLGGFLAGCGIVSAAFAAYLLPRVNMSDLLYHWCVWPTQNYSGITGNSYGFFGVWQVYFAEWGRAAFMSKPVFAASFFFANAFLSLLPFLALACVCLAYTKNFENRAKIGLLAAGAAASLGCLGHRWAFLNMAWAAPLPMVLVAWCFWKLYSVSAGRPRKALAATAAFFFGLLLVYGASLCAETSSSKTIRVSTPAGSLRLPAGKRFEQVRETIKAVSVHVPKDGRVICNGFIPFISFLAQRRCATRFNALHYPGYPADYQLWEVYSYMDGAGETYIISTLPIDIANMTGKYIYRNCELLWHNGSFAIFRKRGQAAAPVQGASGARR